VQNPQQATISYDPPMASPSNQKVTLRNYLPTRTPT
jgi:hypothetical protein